ncbi:hypothetical protein GCM10027440_00310 [Nocardiopsis coralliicola]
MEPREVQGAQPPRPPDGGAGLRALRTALRRRRSEPAGAGGMSERRVQHGGESAGSTAALTEACGVAPGRPGGPGPSPGAGGPYPGGGGGPHPGGRGEQPPGTWLIGASLG